MAEYHPGTPVTCHDMTKQPDPYETCARLQAKFLKSLSQQYPNIEKASSEAINLTAILGLPKGTEQYVPTVPAALLCLT